MNEAEQNEYTSAEAVRPELHTESLPEERSASPQEMLTEKCASKESDCLVPKMEAGETPQKKSNSSGVDVGSDEPDLQPPPLPEAKLNQLESKADALVTEVQTVRDGVAALQKAVTGLYTQTTDAMHKELEKYRKGLVRKLEQELFGELIELYDAADRAVSLVAADISKAPYLLEGIRDQIDAALFNRNVEKREAAVGATFDGRRHHVVRPDIPTGNQALDGTVAATAKPGFDDMDESFKDLRNGCLKLRPVHVHLFKFDPALATPESEPPAIPTPESSEGTDAKQQDVQP